jgi:hypothetical protein
MGVFSVRKPSIAAYVCAFNEKDKTLSDWMIVVKWTGYGRLSYRCAPRLFHGGELVIYKSLILKIILQNSCHNCHINQTVCNCICVHAYMQTCFMTLSLTYSMEQSPF